MSMASDKTSDGKTGSGGGDGDGKPARPRPIDVARVRHLLKTTRYIEAPKNGDKPGGPSIFSRRAAPPGGAAEPSRTRDGAGGSEGAGATRAPRQAPVDAGRRAGGKSGGKSGGKAREPGGAAAAKPPAGGGAQGRAGAVRAPVARATPVLPPRRNAQNSSWFSSQPEMQRLAAATRKTPVQSGADEPGAGEAPAPARRAQSFRDVDRESWFAHQPEVQRLVNPGRMAPQWDRFGLPPLPPEAEPAIGPAAEAAGHPPGATPDGGAAGPEPGLAEPPHTGDVPPPPPVRPAGQPAVGAAMPSGELQPTIRTYGDFSDASPWFVNQPEFRRMRNGGHDTDRRRGGSRLGRFFMVAILAGFGAIAWQSGMVTAADFDAVAGAIQRVRLAAVAAVEKLTTPASVAELESGPESDGGAAAEAPPAPQPVAARSAQPAKRALGRAPTAVGAVVAQLGRATVLAKMRPVDEPTAPAFTGALDFAGGQDFGRSAAADEGGAQQSVLAPSRATANVRAVNDNDAGTGAGSEADPNPFATFSADGGPRVAARSVSGSDGAAGQAAAQAGSTEAEGDTARGEVKPGEVEWAIAKARTLFVEGDAAGAERLVRDVLASDPENIQALMFYGDVLVRDRQVDRAIEIYENVLAIDPTNSLAMVNRGNALLAMGSPSAAVSAAQAALALSETSVPATFLLGKAEAAAGNMRGAMTACERVGVLTQSKSEVEWCRAAAQSEAGNTFVGVRMFISALNSGEQGFVRSRQVFMRDRGLYDGAIDGVSSQALIDAVTECAVADDCIL